MYATYSLPSFSMALPEKHPPWGWSSYGSLGANAIGNWVQCSRSSLTAWPQCIFPQNPAIRVELVEEMVLAPVIDQTIGVVDPAARPHKMIGLAHTGLCYLGGVFGDIGRGRIDGLLHGLCCHGNSWSLNG